MATSIFETRCFLKWYPTFDNPFESQSNSNQKVFVVNWFLSKNIFPVDPYPQHWGHTKIEE